MHRIAMACWKAVRAFTMLLPTSLGSAVGLYSCYLNAFVNWIKFKRILPIGTYLGRDVILRSRLGVLFYARKQSDDLGQYLPLSKQWTYSWFDPKPDEVVIDCGSSVGFFTLLAARRGAFVHSIEPNPMTYSVIERNIKLNRCERNVCLYGFALSDSNGISELLVPHMISGMGSMNSSWNEQLREKMGEDLSFKVRTIKLDELLCDIKMITWLLIDVESSEYDLLLGARETLLKTDKVIIEISYSNTKSVLTLLFNAGFSLWGMGQPEDISQYFFLGRSGRNFR